MDKLGRDENDNPGPGTGIKEFSSPSAAAIDNLGEYLCCRYRQCPHTKIQLRWYLYNEISKQRQR